MISDTSIAAEQFPTMVRGNEQMRALLSLPPVRQGASQNANLQSCVEAFQRGH